MTRPTIWIGRRRDRERVTVLFRFGRLPSFGFTLWRQGALSVLWRGSVGPQIVLGDWWKAHPEVKR